MSILFAISFFDLVKSLLEAFVCCRWLNFNIVMWFVKMTVRFIIRLDVYQLQTALVYNKVLLRWTVCLSDGKNDASPLLRMIIVSNKLIIETNIIRT